VSFALSRLSPEEKKAVRQRLWQRQNGVCFITQKPIDLLRDEVEIDHDPRQGAGRREQLGYCFRQSQ
jgi:hypothetical protein